MIRLLILAALVWPATSFAIEKVEMYEFTQKILRYSSGMEVTLFYNSELEEPKEFLDQMKKAEKKLSKRNIKFYKIDTILYPQLVEAVPKLVISFRGRVIISFIDPAPSANVMARLLIRIDNEIKKQLKIGI